MSPSRATVRASASLLLAAVHASLGCNAVLGNETATLDQHDVPRTPEAESIPAPADQRVVSDASDATAPATPPDAGGPLVVARALDRPSALSIVGTRAYWMQPDGIYDLDLASGAARPRRVVASTDAFAFAVLASRVYFSTRTKDGLFSAAAGETPAVFLSDPHDPRGVAVSGSAVFVGQSELTHGKVFWKDGATTSNQGVPGGWEPWALAASETGTVYFTNRRDVCAGGRVFRLANPPVELSGTEVCPSALAASDGDVFVANAIFGGAVRRLREGAAPVDLALGQGEPVAIAASARDVLWANHATGEIMRSHRAGGAVEVLSRGLQPSGVAFDATGAVAYWLTQGMNAGEGSLVVARLP